MKVGLPSNSMVDGCYVTTGITDPADGESDGGSNA
jgi:hypothetical protein